MGNTATSSHSPEEARLQPSGGVVFSTCLVFPSAGPCLPSLCKKQKRHRELQSHRKMESDSFGVGGDLRNHCVLFFNVMDGKAVSTGMGAVTDLTIG